MAGNSSCADRVPAASLRRRHQSAVIAERQLGTRGPSRLPSAMPGSPVVSTATPSRNDDIPTAITEEGATLQFDEDRRPSSRWHPTAAQRAWPLTLRQPD